MDLVAILTSSIAQGLLWSFLALGVFITFRIMDIPDLTAEGTFPLGGGIAAISIVHGVSPLLALLLAFLGGALAGGVTGLLHTKLKIPPLLAGIITMTGLFSISSRVMGAPNVPLLGQKTLFNQLEAYVTKENGTILVGMVLILITFFVLTSFFKTEVGLSILATGDNPVMAKTNGIPIDGAKVTTYMISNGLIALSGALLAQNNGFADINAGIGTIVVGLAAIIIGEVFMGKASMLGKLMAIVLGSIVYRFILGLVFSLNVEPTDTKLASAIVLVVALCLPQIREMLLSPFKKESLTKKVA